MITEASPILSLLFAKGLGAKTLSQLVDRIVQEEMPIEEIVNLPRDVLVEQFGLRASVADAIHAARTQAERTAQELEQHGVEILVRGIEPYPSHLVEVLGRDAPPILFVRGDLSVLARRAVGFCGARKASEKGIWVASESAKQLAEHDVNVVSGYAKGVDLAAHTSSLEAGGVTTIVLAEGIMHFRAKREVKPLLDDHNHLVVSEFSPRLPWSGRNAMQRNKTIIGLSDAVVCIESGMKGGTHAAADATLQLGLPLFVADYAQPAESAAGNKHFISRGATPLRANRSGTPNLQRVYAAIGIEESAEEADADQTHAKDGESTSDESSTHVAESESCYESGNKYPIG